jgi:hypothetical protein
MTRAVLSPTAAPVPARGRNRWPWFAVVVLTLVAIADGTMVTASHLIHPGLVEDHPWLTSATIDQQKAARARFAATGARLQVTALAAGRMRCEVLGAPAAVITGMGALVIQLYRPDQPALDRDIPWADAAQAQVVTLGHDGFWRVHLRDIQGSEIADAEVDISAADPGPTAQR